MICETSISSVCSARDTATGGRLAGATSTLPHSAPTNTAGDTQLPSPLRSAALNSW
jgi:hypothetical protein